jgi:hypothetical protein
MGTDWRSRDPASPRLTWWMWSGVSGLQRHFAGAPRPRPSESSACRASAAEPERLRAPLEPAAGAGRVGRIGPRVRPSRRLLYPTTKVAVAVAGSQLMSGGGMLSAGGAVHSRGHRSAARSEAYYPARGRAVRAHPTRDKCSFSCAWVAARKPPRLLRHRPGNVEAAGPPGIRLRTEPQIYTSCISTLLRHLVSLASHHGGMIASPRLHPRPFAG